MDAEPHSRPDWLMYVMFFFVSALAVYCNYVFIYHTSNTTGKAFAEVSARVHAETLAGTRPFPYQWRILGSHLVQWGADLTGLGIHGVDPLLKTLFLFLSTIPLFHFARTQVTDMAAMGVVWLYLLLVVVGLAEQYSIYNLNDIILYAGWHACVLAAYHRRLYLLAAVVLVTTLAREVTVLACLLVGLEFLRTRKGLVPVVVVGASFLVPWGFVHWLYPAPVSQLAWWSNFHGNLPIMHPDSAHVLQALRKTFKVAVFFNVGWVLGIRGLLRSKNPFMLELFLVLCFYVTVLYITVDVREMRQFVPLAIILLPATFKELATRGRETAEPPGATLRGGRAGTAFRGKQGRNAAPWGT